MIRQSLLMLVLILATLGTAIANTQPAIIFSQDVVAMNADGSLVPSVKIDPQTTPGMQTLDFDLGRQRLLRIETNISDATARGLAEIVATVKRSYAYVEATTGLPLDRGVLLYLIELDQIPYAYNFSASYNDVGRWGEVRLALIERGAPLSGRHAAPGLSDLLFDTLPHELGHDVLSGIPQLRHDIDGAPSNHTRWFIEGICEVLAKGFSQQEAPDLHPRFLAQRRVGTVLADRQMLSDMLNWSQTNSNGMALESDLYGAAMLTLMAWTKTLPLNELIRQIQAHTGPLQGDELITLMHLTSGVGMDEMSRRAHLHGAALSAQVVLAHNQGAPKREI